jgi:hypothetical protein
VENFSSKKQYQSLIEKITSSFPEYLTNKINCFVPEISQLEFYSLYFLRKENPEFFAYVFPFDILLYVYWVLNFLENNEEQNTFFDWFKKL